MKIDKKKVAIIAGSITALLVLPYACDAYFCWNYRYKAKPVIELAEKFKEVKGRTAKSSAEMGYTEDGFGTGPFYAQMDSTRYQIYYADDNGNCYVYDSGTEEWFSSDNIPGN